MAQGATTYTMQGTTFPSSHSMVAYPGASVTHYFPMTVQQAWDNHFSAFGEKNVDKILLDYDETSVIRVYTSGTGALTEFRGTQQVREFFTGCFQDLPDMTTLEAPVKIVEEDYKQVFLVWKCPSSGVVLASDTFIFGPDNKIKRQNITLDKKAGVMSQAAHSIGSAGAAVGNAAGAAVGAVGAA